MTHVIPFPEPCLSGYPAVPHAPPPVIDNLDSPNFVLKK